MKDFMKLYSNLVQRCFDDCANDFTTKSLTGKEVSLEIVLFKRGGSLCLLIVFVAVVGGLC